MVNYACAKCQLEVGLDVDEKLDITIKYRRRTVSKSKVPCNAEVCYRNIFLHWNTGAGMAPWKRDLIFTIAFQLHLLFICVTLYSPTSKVQQTELSYEL